MHAGQRHHVDGLVLGIGLVLGRTDADAQSAAGAVVGRDLDPEDMPARSLALKVAQSKVAGLVSLDSIAGSTTLGRIAACGQTSEHLLHWMQRSWSQIGTSRAMPRFSYCVVAVGQAPSGPKALTGSRSPLPSIMTAVMRCTKSGEPAATTGGRRRLVVGAAGMATSCMLARVWSTAAQLRLTTSSPFLM